MPTSVPGSKRRGAPASALNPGPAGFTLLELLVVLAIVALSVGLVSLALRDPDQSRLETEGERLALLLEQARVEARVSGVPVSWAPVSEAQPGATSDVRQSAEQDAGQAAQFRFMGLPPSQPMPTRWLEAATRAQIVGGNSVVLGPQAILPAQRIVLSLGIHKLELASDGLSAFAAVP